MFIDATAMASADAGLEYHMGEDPKSYTRAHRPGRRQDDAQRHDALLPYHRNRRPLKPICPRISRRAFAHYGAHIVTMPNGDHLLNVVDMLTEMPCFAPNTAN